MAQELLILRHAKSAWDTDAPSDFERPLAGRGKRDCPRVGRRLAEAGLLPDLVLCSPARRARQTARRVLKAAGADREAIRYEERLYGAGPDTVLEILAERGGGYSRILVVGHNPGLADLVRRLGGAAAPVAPGGKLLPTAALARFSWEGPWGDPDRSRIRLLEIVRPRDLGDA